MPVVPIKIQNVMEGQKVSVASGKTLYLSPDKKDIIIVEPNNPLGGTIFQIIRIDFLQKS